MANVYVDTRTNPDGTTPEVKVSGELGSCDWVPLASELLSRPRWQWLDTAMDASPQVRQILLAAHEQGAKMCLDEEGFDLGAFIANQPYRLAQRASEALERGQPRRPSRPGSRVC